jgi:transglutaminase-like putative cysteine protease
MARRDQGRVLEAAMRRVARGERRASELAAPPPPAPIARRAKQPPSVLDAALRRAARDLPPLAPSGVEGRSVACNVAPPPPPPAPPRRQPVFTLEPARAPADPRALASLLADDVASKLDQLCYLWNVVNDLEPFAAAGEPSLRRRAAELFLVAGGSAEIPLEGPLRAAASFLAKHGMREEYVEKLCGWYLK